jgi:hypothetical protein
MQLITNELLNPCHFTHLVIKPNHLINYDFLNFGLILKFYVIDDLGMTGKV